FSSSVFFFVHHLLPRSTLFHYTTLFRSYWYRLCPTCDQGRLFVKKRVSDDTLYLLCEECFCVFNSPYEACDGNNCEEGMFIEGQDRKSTRLNSSHVKISYAVFCLKKKKT